ncbi:MAG TPA: hypothetical protein VFB12_24030 [Ktedonobacteraceae bacterium]|nr:hypothetical protein [Ktedonobacteraceae bacterium]
MKLYKDDVHARRVTTAAQAALAVTSDSTMPYTREHLRIAPQTWAASVCSVYMLSTSVMMSKYNKLLRQRATALVEVPCRQHGIPIQVLGEYPLFSGLKLVRGTTSDVVIVPADEDPLIVEGDFPLPQQVKQRLRAIEQAGVPFDMLYTYIAHEVPPYSVPSEGPVPLEVVLPPAPQRTVQTSERLGKIAHVATTSVLAGLGRTATSSLRGAAIAGAVLGAATSVLLDPLIFGAIADERGMATWFVLAQWAW